MSLSSAMQAGLSGLVANANDLSTIANNIANSDTVGYKQTDTNFESLVSSTDADSANSSGGVISTTQQLVNVQGQAIQTNSPTDLMISGQGFFVVSQNASAIGANNGALFTRAGSFTENSNGYLVNTAGLVLQGWPANASGVVSSNPESLSSLEPINIPQISGAVSATTSVAVSANVNSGQTVSTAATAAGTTPPGAGAYNASTNSMAMYEDNNATGVAPDYSVPLIVSTSEGGEQTLQLDLLKSSTPNQWYAELVATPASSVDDGTGLSDGQLGSCTVTFSATGQISSISNVNGALTANGDNLSLAIGASSGTPAAGAVNWASSLGVAGQTIALNLAGTNGNNGLSQFDSTSEINSITTNGTAFGTVSNVSISSSGVVSAVFSNGISQVIAQVPVATFPNPDGLTAVSGDAYQASLNSGNFILEQAGQGGSGTIDSSELEASTVDLSSQLTNMITAQNAYSASSKIITTVDQMMQSLLQAVQ